MKTDLHLHTTASDGSMSPKSVVDWAKKCGLELISVTDHDTIDGIEEARKECLNCGIQFVNGIEFSTYSICEIHILGYNIDYRNKDFLAELENIKEMRTERNLMLGEKLDKLGVNLDLDYSSEGLGRMNVARQMVKQQYVSDICSAFDKYLGVNGKAFTVARRLAPVEAVNLIKKYGGFSSVAHPKKYLADGRLAGLLEGLKKFGLNGLEVNYPSHTDADKLALSALATRFGLLPTGGSDFHGDEDKDFIFELDKRTQKALKVY